MPPWRCSSHGVFPLLQRWALSLTLNPQPNLEQKLPWPESVRASIPDGQRFLTMLITFLPCATRDFTSCVALMFHRRCAAGSPAVATRPRTAPPVHPHQGRSLRGREPCCWRRAPRCRTCSAAGR